jgi:hypothetical protein
LTALKRTNDMTRPQVEAWFAVLGIFPVEVVNAAVIEICLTETRFPEVGDLYQICRRSIPVPYCPMGEQRTDGRPTKAEVSEVAKRLGLKVSKS